MCVGSRFTYQTQYTNGSSYAWQVVGGRPAGTSAASIDVTWTTPGTGLLVVTETSNPNNGPLRCLGTSDTLRVLVVPPPATNLTLAGPARACAGSGPVQFTLPGAPSSTYAFFLTDAAGQQTPLPATGNTATLPLPPVGAYTVSARETSACAGPLYSHPFTVDPRPAAGAIAGPARVCPEGRRGLAYSLAGPPGATYQWAVAGGTITGGQGTGRILVDFDDDAAVRRPCGWWRRRRTAAWAPPTR